MIKYFITLCLLAMFLATSVQAQDTSPAASLEFSYQMYGKLHVIADVSLDTQPTPIRYRHDHTINADTITINGASYTRSKDSAWRGTGNVTDALANQLNFFASVAPNMLEPPTSSNTAQGGFVWKLIDKSISGNSTLLTYEQTREHPRPNGVYPRFTFIKGAQDQDGKLFVQRAAGQLKQPAGIIPFVVQYNFMIPISR